jgi:hypothetical protein
MFRARIQCNFGSHDKSERAALSHLTNLVSLRQVQVLVASIALLFSFAF